MNHTVPARGLMRTMVFEGLVDSINKRAESREPSCVCGEARRLELPRPHGRPSSEATPTFPPPARRRHLHVPVRMPAGRDAAPPTSAGGRASP